jgi:hypothetical protein
MENKRLRREKGTVAVGAIAILLTFMAIITCIGLIITEYARYNLSVKYADEVAVARAREKLSVVQASNRELNVTNEGSTLCIIVGVFYINPADNNPRYVRLQPPEAVPLLETRTIQLPQVIPANWALGVVTSYGNLFWEE